MPGDRQRQRAQRDPGAGHGDSGGGGTGPGTVRAGRRHHRRASMASAAWSGSRPAAAEDRDLERTPPSMAGRAARGASRSGTSRPRRAMAGRSACSPTSAALAEAAEALECGAEGVGVLRTEFLFLGRAAPPGEDEQFARLSRHRRSVRRASAGDPHARYRRRQEPAVRRNRRGGQSVPRLARHPR